MDSYEDSATRLDLAPGIAHPGEWPGCHLVTQVINPVTRSLVRINPGFSPQSRADWDGFVKAINSYFQSVWELARLDPAEVNAPWGWRTYVHAGHDPRAGEPQQQPAGGST
jgi:hypothetical protein